MQKESKSTNTDLESKYIIVDFSYLVGIQKARAVIRRVVKASKGRILRGWIKTATII